MKLYVHGDRHGNVTNVWVEGVPADALDSDVQYTIECVAAEGDENAKRALTAMGAWGWLDLCERHSGTRVYVDRAFCDCCY